MGPHFLSTCFFFFFPFRACRIYCKFLYIQDNSHWIPFSCLPGSFLNHTQFSRARITGWYYWQSCWQLYICCPDIQFLIKSVFSIAPCQFWLSLSSQSQFPIPCPIFMPFFIIQVDYNPLPSLIKPRPLLLSSMLTNFLVLFCPLGSQQIYSWDNTQREYQKPPRETLFISFSSCNKKSIG